jgi:hypothetical protein
MVEPAILTPEEEDRILAEYARRFGAPFAFKSLEDLLCSPEGFGLTTATPLQRAICRMIQGAPLAGLENDPVVQGALGFGEYVPSGKPPDEVIILAAVRTAKSMMAAAAAIWATQTVDCGMLKDGEIARYSVVSLELDNARVVHSHILGALLKPALAKIRVTDKDTNKWKAVIDETGVDVVGSEFLYHPTGRPIEIRVVAGKRAGGSLVSRWSAGVCLDEAPRMVGSGDHVVNYDDMKNAVEARLLGGASILSIGSPWAASGPIYDIVTNEWGRPTAERVVIKATGPAMNPYRWTPEYCEKIRRKNPEVYRTDVLAEFVDTENQLIPNTVLRACISKRQENLPYNPRMEYVAAMDPATRKNAWTLTIHGKAGGKMIQVAAQEWQGNPMDPLRPKEVLREAAELLKEYHMTWAYTDQWSAEALVDIADDFGLELVPLDWTQNEKTEAFLSLLVGMQEGHVELMGLPNIERDLKSVKRSARPGGGVSIQFMRTNDGRHADYAPPIARALKQWIEEEEGAPTEPGTPEFDRKLEADMEERDVARFNNKQKDENQEGVLFV